MWYNESDKYYMKKYFIEKFKKSKKSFDDIKSKAFFRVYNLATRLDLGHSKRERKKKKS